MAAVYFGIQLLALGYLSGGNLGIPVAAQLDKVGFAGNGDMAQP